MPLFTSRFANLSVETSALGAAVPANHSLSAWAYDPSAAINSVLLGAGVVRLVAVYVPHGVAVTKLYWWVTGAGATPTAGQNEVGIYDSAGTRLVAANVDASISATGVKSTTITSTSLEAGKYYWCAAVFNASTIPSVAWGTTLSGGGAAANVGLAASTARFGSILTGQTALPATITPANITLASGGPWFAVGA